ncbi:hypothetical protein [Thermococcus nautili]|uniref:Uncharacterized protein n=1 Tax=Thermococcus nautili TaxID=195522 RepID=W8PMY0_9EURY|nr:hypothetical protein [Thermococcus nautili]AHL23394.1 hypothetical protein BD01_1791 [Thermococcus nautili]
MKVRSLVFGLAVLMVTLAGVVYYSFNYYNFNYQWKTNLEDYREYRLIGNSTLNGYVKADGEVSVYILTKEDFKRLKKGELFSYYRAWEHVKAVELNDVRIPDGDYLLVIKNEENGMQWISVKLVDKK